MSATSKETSIAASVLKDVMMKYFETAALAGAGKESAPRCKLLVDLARQGGGDWLWRRKLSLIVVLVLLISFCKKERTGVVLSAGLPLWDGEENDDLN